MVKIRLHKRRLNESGDDDGMDVAMDDAISRITQDIPGTDQEAGDDAGEEQDEPGEKPYITPGLNREIRHGDIDDLIRRMEARRNGTLQKEDPADAEAGMTEFQKLRKIQQEGKEAEYFNAEERDSAVDEMLTIFRPGNDVRKTVGHVERILEKNVITVAIRFKGSAIRGTQTCWSSQSTFGSEARRELEEYRKSKKGQMSISVIWFTDAADGEFIKDFFSGSVASSFKNSGVMLRLSHFNETCLACLPGLKYFTTLIFGERFEFDLAWSRKPTRDLQDVDDENVRLAEKTYIKDLGLLNFNLINVLDNIPCLCRIIVDEGHPDFYNDKRYNLIRRTPIHFKSLDDIRKRINKHQYVYDQYYLLRQLNDQENVLWYAPSTWASDNTGMEVYGRDGKLRTVSGPGRDPGVFRVPDGITALNPFCFGQRNPGIRRLYLPASIEVPPLFAYSFLPNLEEIRYAGDQPDNIPVGCYMNYEPKNRQKKIEITGDIGVVEDLSFANTAAREVLFDNPDEIYYIGRGAFGSGMVNPFGNPGTVLGGDNAKFVRSRLWNHAGSEASRYIDNVLYKATHGQSGSTYNVLPSGTCLYSYIPVRHLWEFNNGEPLFDKNERCERSRLNGTIKYTNILSGNNVAIIGEDAFAGCQDISFGVDGELIIPDSVSRIGACAFADALYNTEVLTLPPDLDKERIGPCAFYISRYLMLKYGKHLSINFIDGAFGNPMSGTGNKDYEAMSRELADEFQKISKLRIINIPSCLKDCQSFCDVFGLTPECARSLGITINYI